MEFVARRLLVTYFPCMCVLFRHYQTVSTCILCSTKIKRPKIF